MITTSSEPLIKQMSSLEGVSQLSLALFYACLLSTKSVYSVGVGLLILTALGWHISRRSTYHAYVNEKASLGLYALLILIFGNGLVVWYFHGNPNKQLDLLSRYLLLVPILYMFSAVRLNMYALWCSFSLASLSALWIIPAQYGGPIHDGRIYGYTGAIQFGNIALSLALFSLVAIFSQYRLPQRTTVVSYLSVAGLLAGLTLSLLAGSRGGWIALPPIFVLLAWAYIPKQYWKQAMLTLAIMVALCAVALSQSTTIQSRIDKAIYDIEQFEAGNANTSIGGRFAIWHANWLLIQERPITGWSEQQHTHALEQLVANKTADPVVLNLANAHNNYIETWVHLGLTGLMLQCLLLIYCFWGFCRHIRSLNPRIQAYAVCGSLLVIMYAFANLTQNMLERNNTLLFFLLSIAVFWSQIYPLRQHTGKHL